MFRVKVFDTSFHNGDLESEINEWLSGNKNIEIVRIDSSPMLDHYDSGAICNQWVRTFVVYREAEKDA